MRVAVRVIPRAKRFRIEQSSDVLKVYITEPAVGGKANKKLIEVLAGYFNIRKYNLTIIKGQKQKNKVVEINDR